MKKRAKGLIPPFTFLLSLVFLFPVLVTVIGSLMSEAELTQVFGPGGALRLIPNRVTFEGYFRLLFSSQVYLNMFWNSLFIALSIVAGQTAASLVMAYLLAKLRFRGRGLLLFLYTAIMLLPFQATLLPHYLMAKQLGIYNTWWAIILPAVLSPFGAIILYPFIGSIPDDIIGAALLETSSRMKVLARVVAPNVRAGLVAVIALTFADSWNLVEQPLILLQDAWLHPLSLALNSIQQSSPAISFTGSVLYMLPVVMLYALCHEELVSGLSDVVRM